MRKVLEIIWPGFRTAGYLSQLRQKGILDEARLADLRKRRYWYNPDVLNLGLITAFFYFTLFGLGFPHFFEGSRSRSQLEFLIIFGLGLTFWFVRKMAYQQWKLIYLMSSGKRTTGEILSFYKSKNKALSRTDFGFSDESGVEYVNTMTLMNSVASEFLCFPGDSLTVAYDPSDPDEMSILVIDELDVFNVRRAVSSSSQR